MLTLIPKWNALCSYLGILILDMPWPSLNTPEGFYSLAKPIFQVAIGE